ncbi:unnamed protein product, partial [Sphacelaria rigidula]
MGPKNWRVIRQFKRKRQDGSTGNDHNNHDSHNNSSPSSTPSTSRTTSSDSSNYSGSGQYSSSSSSGSNRHRSRHAAMNLGNVKGHQVVVGTCDIRHDRKATAELIDLLNETAANMLACSESDNGGSGDQERHAAKKNDTDNTNEDGKTGEAAGSSNEEGGQANNTPAAAATADSKAHAASPSPLPERRGTLSSLLHLSSTLVPRVWPDDSAKSSKTSDSGVTENGDESSSSSSAIGNKNGNSSNKNNNSQGGKPENISIEESMRRELEAARAGNTADTGRFVAVNTSVKGVIMVCVMDRKIDVIRLVDAMFDNIRTTRKRRTRFLERVTPMAITAYANFESLKEAAKKMVGDALPPVADDVSPINLPDKKAAAPDPISKETTTAIPSIDTAAAAAATTSSAASSAANPGVNGGPEKEEEPDDDEGTERSATGADCGGGEDDGSVAVVASAAAAGEEASEKQAASSCGVAGSEKSTVATNDVVREIENDTTAAVNTVSAARGARGSTPSPVLAGDAGAEAKQQQHVKFCDEAAETENKAEEVLAAPTTMTTNKRWTFRVDPRRRHSGLSRLDLINALASSAGEGHAVTMKNPE